MNRSAAPWTIRAQIARILRSDATTTAIDAPLGLVYVFAGFYLPPGDTGLGIFPPFVVLGLCMGYLTMRILGPETAENSACFYANLPRSQRVVYWTHIAYLMGYGIAGEVLIAACAALGVNSTVLIPWQFALPLLAIVPFAVMAIIVWMTSAQANSLLATLAVIFAFFFAIMAIGAAVNARTRDPVSGQSSMALCWFIVTTTATGLAICDGAKHYTTREIGEMP